MNGASDGLLAAYNSWMRQLLGEKKTRRLRQQTGLPIAFVKVRGNTEHRKDLYLEDGTIVHLWPDGETQPCENGWTRSAKDSPLTPA